MPRSMRGIGRKKDNITDERDIKDAIVKAQKYVEALPKVEKKAGARVEGR